MTQTDDTQALLERLQSKTYDAAHLRGGYMMTQSEAALYDLKEQAPDLARQVVALTRERDAMAEALRKIGAVYGRVRVRPKFDKGQLLADEAVTLMAMIAKEARAALTPADEREKG